MKQFQEALNEKNSMKGKGKLFLALNKYIPNPFHTLRMSVEEAKVDLEHRQELFRHKLLNQ